MKKTLFIVAIATLSLTSCKKDYTCSCDTTVTAAGVKTVTTSTVIFNDTQSNATTSCDALDTGLYGSGFVFTQTLCSIK